MRWTFSDGTTVHLGGQVEGDGPFAAALRAELARPDVTVTDWPSPAQGEQIPLDRGDPERLDMWLQERARRHHVELVSAPTGLGDWPREGEQWVY